MEDLQQAQILDSCRLALPEGLKELMSDISREVLRSRPHNLYQFIADYLFALLEAREKLSIAAQIYKDICNCDYSPELDDELKDIGLTEDEIEEVKKVIIKYLEKDKVKEENLLAKLLKINIEEKMIPHIQNAVREAFKKSQMKKRQNVVQDLSHNDNDNSAAAAHTLKLYWKPKLAEEQSFPNPEEGQTHWDSDDTDHELNHQRTITSSTDSSVDIFKNIKYDGGIKDLFISNNCKPHMNSSLTPLTGSYGTIQKTCACEPNLSEEEHAFVNYENDDNELTNNRISFQLTSKKVHTEDHKLENELRNTENNNDKHHQVEGDTNNCIVKKEEKKDLDDIDNIEDEAVIADNESDISVEEELNTETRDM